MRLHSKIIFLCLMAIAVIFSQVAPADAQLFVHRNNHPALWKIQNGDAIVYIFGSHHVLRQNTKWVPRSIDSIVKVVDEFVFEVEPSEERMPDAQAYIDDSGYLPEGESLHNMLSEETRDDLRVLARNLRLDSEQMDRQRPWFAVLTLSSAFYGQREYSVEYGADVRILRHANWLEKPVSYLETPRQQLEFFAEAIAGASVEGFEKVVMNFRQDPDAIIANIRDWREGNVEATAMRLHEFFEHNPRARKILLDDRNAAWATQIEQMLSNDKTYFVTVGVGHLGGPKSVIEILCQNGWDVQRVPTMNEEVPTACGPDA